MELAAINADGGGDLVEDVVTTVARAPSTWAQNLADWAIEDRRTVYQQLDRVLHGYQAKLTGGLSPMALWSATFDWAGHMANSPFRRVELAVDGLAQFGKLAAVAMGSDQAAPSPEDRRFAGAGWQRSPFHFFEQSFLLTREWMERATSPVPGVDTENQRIVRFAARQWLDIFSPSNLPATNPEILAATWNEGGRNLADGLKNYLADLERAPGAPTPDAPEFMPGKNVAITPGKVVFRNELIELIQYDATTDKVRAEPILITPAWIMKYYILDLSPHNSLIRYLTEQGHTVFCISWRNPGGEMRDVPFDAYRSSGFMAALDAVTAICPDFKVHACGYCLGGTLLTIAAAAMARDGDDRLASITLLAAQTDFTEVGELQLFTTEAQVAFLEDLMSDKGYLEGAQMGGAFQLLRSRELIWSRLLRTYWLGEPDQPNDLLAWNADTTRMPARMHSEYLRSMFLGNELAEGRYRVEDRPIALSDIRAPFFVVGTEADHVAPWRSVYKIHLLNGGEVTFVLASGGHNAGIVSEPGHPRRHFRIAGRAAQGAYCDPETWSEGSQLRDGSWWPAWSQWLAERSGPQDCAPAHPVGSEGRCASLGDAPGHYVLEH